MNFIQGTLQMVEVGKGTILVRLVPLLTALVIIGVSCDFFTYRGLDDPQSMDNAQLARQIVRGQGFTTEFLRPHAVAQLRDNAVAKGLHDLFPPDLFPAGTRKIIPDTYNAPGYPYLLAAWFYLTHPEFEQTPSAMGTSHIYSGDKWIPLFNQIFLIITAILVFALGRRLFDARVAWLAIVCFLSTDMIWRFSLTALSTTFLMMVLTAAFACLLEVVSVGESCFDSEERSFAPAWYWGIAAGVLLAVACLTRLHMLVLLVPVLALLIFMPRASYFLPPVIVLIVAIAVVPWFVHMNRVSGSPLGSNAPLMLYGEGDYTGNQIYCTMTIPSYEQLFKDASKKEYTGFRYHFEHAWSLLGASPLIIFFGASILHQFKRRRTRLFHWILFGSAVILMLANNLGSASPDPIDPWNVLILLFPCMLVFGSAFFFILLDRLSLQLWLLNNLVIIALIGLTLSPLAMTVFTPSPVYYAFPPYMPPVIKQFAQFTDPDEWVTTDMPWATAWYGDRASLWLPDSLADFTNLHDNVCPSGVILFTPVTWTKPFADISVGEFKEWFPFIGGSTAPPNFPLSIHTVTGPGGPEYSLWSDKPRWQSR